MQLRKGLQKEVIPEPSKFGRMSRHWVKCTKVEGSSKNEERYRGKKSKMWTSGLSSEHSGRKAVSGGGSEAHGGQNWERLSVVDA